MPEAAYNMAGSYDTGRLCGCARPQIWPDVAGRRQPIHVPGGCRSSRALLALSIAS